MQQRDWLIVELEIDVNYVNGVTNEYEPSLSMLLLQLSQLQHTAIPNLHLLLEAPLNTDFGT